MYETQEEEGGESETDKGESESDGEGEENNYNDKEDGRKEDRNKNANEYTQQLNKDTGKRWNGYNNMALKTYYSLVELVMNDREREDKVRRREVENYLKELWSSKKSGNGSKKKSKEEDGEEKINHEEEEKHSILQMIIENPGDTELLEEYKKIWNDDGNSNCMNKTIVKVTSFSKPNNKKIKTDQQKQQGIENK